MIDYFKLDYSILLKLEKVGFAFLYEMINGDGKQKKYLEYFKATKMQKEF